jgi:hypothetical protein
MSLSWSMYKSPVFIYTFEPFEPWILIQKVPEQIFLSVGICISKRYQSSTYCSSRRFFDVRVGNARDFSNLRYCATGLRYSKGTCATYIDFCLILVMELNGCAVSDVLCALTALIICHIGSIDHSIIIIVLWTIPAVLNQSDHEWIHWKYPI